MRNRAAGHNRKESNTKSYKQINESNLIWKIRNERSYFHEVIIWAIQVFVQLYDQRLEER